ncbi:MAG: hypothetical protein AAGE94_24285 [Acidobacteriota bacterium]
MNTAEHTTLLEWLDLDLDHAKSLAPNDRAALEARLANDAELRAERRSLEALHSMLDADRVDVREGFAEQVMESLPAAAWDRSARSTAWRLPLAMMLGLTLVSVMLLGGASADGPIVGTSLAVLDFLQTTTLAGSGILVAAWRGAGFGLETWVATSGLNLMAFATLVVCLNLLFFSLLRRRAKAPAATPSSEG